MRMSDQQRAVLDRMTDQLRFREPYPTCATLYLDLATLDQLEHDQATPIVVDPHHEEDTLVLRWTLGGEEFRLFAARVVLAPKSADARPE